MSALVQPGAKLGPWVVKSVVGGEVRALHESLGTEVVLFVREVVPGEEDKYAALFAGETGRTGSLDWRVVSSVGVAPPPVVEAAAPAPAPPPPSVPLPPPSAPSTPLEKILQPGELVRFERHPLGWPPLTGRTVVVYGALLVLAALPALAGHQLTLTIQKLALPVPVMVPALALVAVIELVRFAAFRSRLYVATNRRVLVLGGILATKLRGDLARERMRGLQLVGTEPAIALEERKVLLSGLDEADLESVRAALGEPLLPVLPPAKVKKRRHWRRPFALRVTLLLVVFVEVEGWVQRENEARFRATSAKVRGALGAAEAAISSLVALETGQAVARKTTEGDYSNPFMEQARLRSRVLVRKRELVSVETRCERTRNLIPLYPTVTVVPDPEKPWNARFLEELRIELDREGIEAVWPK